MSKRSKRMFIIELEILNGCWDYKEGQIIRSAVISNNVNNAIHSFENEHCGSEYPLYQIISVEDTLNTGFFMPKIDSPNLL